MKFSQSTLFLLCFQFANLLFGQQVSGVIVDDKSNKPLPGVNISSFLNPQKGGITDQDGFFSISISEHDSILTFQYIGYKGLMVKLPNLNDTIRLQKGILTQQVIIAYHPEDNEEVTTHEIDFRSNPALVHTSVDQIINMVPGVFMQTGSLNTNRITIRGQGNRSAFGTNGIKIYIDDIPIHSNNGESTLEDFGTNIISKTEIIKGPTGPSYGSGLNGGILIKTDNGLYNQNTHFRSFIEVGPYQTYRTANTLELSTKPQGTIHRFRLHQSFTHSDGYRDNNRFDRHNLALNYRLRHGNHTLKILANRVDLISQIPGALNIDDFNAFPRKAAFIWGSSNGFENYERLLAGLNYSYSFDPYFSIGAISYGRQFSSLELRPFNTVEEKTNTYGSRFKITKGIPYASGFLQTKIGVDFQKENIDQQFYETIDSIQGPQFDESTGESRLINTYLNSTLTFDAGWELSLGGEYIHTNISKDRNENQKSGSFFPSFSLSRLINRNRMFLKVSKGGNFPSLDQISISGAILKPEVGWNIEIGSKGFIRKYGIGYRFSLYRMYISNQIVQRFTPSQEAIVQNGGSSILNGLECSIRKKWKFSNITNHSLETTFSGTANHHRFNDFIDGNNDYSNNELTGSPSILLGMNMSYTQSNLSMSLEAKHVGGFAMNDHNSSFSNPYTLLKANMEYTLLNLNNWTIIVGSDFNNILNEKYASMISVNAQSFSGSLPRYYYPGLPKHLIFNINVKYSW